MAIRIRWSWRAARQFEDICEHISQDSKSYASVFARRVNAIVRSMPTAPKLGRMVPEYGDENLRERVYQRYRIVYRLRGEVIEVVAICHGARPLEHAMNDDFLPA